MIRILTVLVMCWAGFAQAQTLDFPSNATLQREIVSADDSYALPVGVWDAGAIPTRAVEGRLSQQAWRISAQSLTTLQILRPLREQLRNARFRVIFECQAEACGGFDFRFATKALPPPEMQINIGDYRFLAAERVTAEGPEVLSLFVSRTARAGFVQVTHVGPMGRQDDVLAQAQSPAIPSAIISQTTDLEAQLDTVGRAVLSDLTFETGSAQLGDGVFASLTALADYLIAYPDRTVALVGHTDTSGGLEQNIALSKRRAASVLERLVTDYGAARRQLAAEGMGYLAPIASNATAQGRLSNRRVEVIMTSANN